MLEAFIDPAPTFFRRIVQVFKLIFRIPFIAFWLWKHREATTLPIVHKICDALQAPTYGIKKLAAQGYCYGGYYSITLAVLGRVDAFLAIHPSGTTPELIGRVQRPGCFLLAANDFSFPPAKVAAARAQLEEKAPSDSLRFEFKEYAGVKHGFAIRGNERDPTVRAPHLTSACYSPPDHYFMILTARVRHDVSHLPIS
jgi:dienelactone hydrolase